jgi:hypothetical protein
MVLEGLDLWLLAACTKPWDRTLPQQPLKPA